MIVVCTSLGALQTVTANQHTFNVASLPKFFFKKSAKGGSHVKFENHLYAGNMKTVLKCVTVRKMAVHSNAELCQHILSITVCFLYPLCQSDRKMCSCRLHYKALKDTQHALCTHTHTHTFTGVHMVTGETWIDMNLFCNYDRLHICLINVSSLGFLCFCTCSLGYMTLLAICLHFIATHPPGLYFVCIYVCVLHTECSGHRPVVFLSPLLSFSSYISNLISQIINNKRKPFLFILPLSSPRFPAQQDYR